MSKGDKFYFENYSERALLTRDAANYLVECLENYNADKIIDMLEKMHSFEHSADIKKHEMGDNLAKAFVTPIDREDLDLLSHQLDNVSDTLEEILQKFYIFNITKVDPAAITFSKNIVKLCDMLVEMMDEFKNFKKSKKMQSLIISCNDMEEECDKLFLETIHHLTKNSTDALVTISRYKIFDCFEACADACEHVSECVASVIMKNT